jgi:diaminopimelate decarboxylase
LPDLVAYKWFYHIHPAHTAGGPVAPARVAGPLCDGGDVFSDPEDGDRAPETRLLPASLAANDLLWVFDVGAYSLEQMSQYNGRYRPGAILIRADGGIQQIRTPDTFADLIAKDIPLTDGIVEHASGG